MINILIVEEQHLFWEGIAALLKSEPDMTMMEMYTTEQDIRSALRREVPNVVLINLGMEKIDAMELTIYIKDHYPRTKIILYASEVKEAKFIRGILEGAHAILLQSIDGENLTRTIRDVSKGQYVFSGEVAKILAKKVVDLKYDKQVMLKRKLESRNIQLTDRELEVAYLLRDDRTNQSMAQELRLSNGTIKNYMSSLYQKLGFYERKELIAFLKQLLEIEKDS